MKEDCPTCLGTGRMPATNMEKRSYGLSNESAERLAGIISGTIICETCEGRGFISQEDEQMYENLQIGGS